MLDFKIYRIYDKCPYLSITKKYSRIEDWIDFTRRVRLRFSRLYRAPCYARALKVDIRRQITDLRTRFTDTTLCQLCGLKRFALDYEHLPGSAQRSIALLWFTTFRPGQPIRLIDVLTAGRYAAPVDSSPETPFQVE